MAKISKRKVKIVDKKRGEKDILRRKYEDLKHRMESTEASETLLKYKILSEAANLARKIYGRHFSINRLAIDFETPITTVKRVLSLEKASDYAWKMIDENKIGAHKVAQILMAINREKQDEIIKLAIEQKLSTSQIKKIRLYDGDVRKLRLQAAVDKGFAGQWNAVDSFKRTIFRMEELLRLDISSYPADKKAIIQVGLERVKNKISDFLSKLDEEENKK